ncbi:MAG: hypothetical protein HY721_21840 [Planctomycetes bacterium]|nr:hypothetical protein [Planctomycetota bacterium]
MTVKARAFAREHPDEFDKVAKDALPLAGNLLLGKFPACAAPTDCGAAGRDGVEAEYDRREKAASVRAARELIREARREGAELDVFIQDVSQIVGVAGAGQVERCIFIQDVSQIVGLLLRSSVKSIL